MIDQNKNIYVSYWFLLITLLVGVMIIVGGLTRLTDSGLSITKWDLITGIIPPITFESWNDSFSLYKQIPEYKLLNSSMTLNEFKVIFWWEYTHRLLGRLIGILYLLPLIYFTFKKFIKKKDMILFYFIFFLICFQGFVGWYMVKSGLVERTDVSHYRLSIHLTFAFIIFILLKWNYLKYKYNNSTVRKIPLPMFLPVFFSILILLQISIGALVSGLDAGKIYQTWPLMNYKYFPDDSNFSDLLNLKSFETPSIVQFFHRNIAYVILLFFLFISIFVFKNDTYIHLRKTLYFTFLVLIFQIILGVLTVLSGAEMVLASLHQLGSIILISCSVFLVYNNYRTN